MQPSGKTSHAPMNALMKNVRPAKMPAIAIWARAAKKIASSMVPFATSEWLNVITKRAPWPAKLVPSSIELKQRINKNDLFANRPHSDQRGATNKADE